MKLVDFKLVGLKLVGLTGGIGSGKTTVSDQWQRMGIPVIDTDVIAHDLTAAGGAAIPSIVSQFGAEAIDATGAMDRQWMRQHVFEHPDAKQQLEAILHPMIQQTAWARYEQLQQATTQVDGQESSVPYAVVVVPLLVESAWWQTQCWQIVTIDCEEEIQHARVMQRSQLSAALVQKIIAQQSTREQRRNIAHHLVHNADDLGALSQQIEQLHQRLCLLLDQA
jgi:dephospho-CoA kinase